MARRGFEQPDISPNELVAWNLAEARRLRGWTQAEAAERVAPYLGVEWSVASWSDAERSWDPDHPRSREFTADEIVAFSQGFGLPIIWWFLPPPPDVTAFNLIGAAAGHHTHLDRQAMLELLLDGDDAVRERVAALIPEDEAIGRPRLGADLHKIADLLSRQEAAIAALDAATKALRRKLGVDQGKTKPARKEHT